jgi:ubiquinone/menaquinone biosynthesis C-methylase UbiE
MMTGPDAGGLAASPFAGAAGYYDRFRPPYPQEVFDWLVREHGLDGHGRLLDVGCGTGRVTFPLCRWFDDVVAIDPDEDMLQVARTAAAKRGLTTIRFINMRAEAVGRDLAPLRLVTFGASFHWMDQVAVANRMHELLEPGGGLVAVAPNSVWEGGEDWQRFVVDTIKKHVGEERRAGAGTYSVHKRHEEYLAKTAFVDLKVVTFRQALEWGATDVLGYLYSTSFASKAVLGAAREKFERELLAGLAEFEAKGPLTEDLKISVISARRR